MRNYLLAIVYLGFFSIAGSVIGFSVGNNIHHRSSSGEFTSWKILDSTLKFEHIIDANTSMVWAQAANGKKYSWESNCQPQSKCNEWTEADKIPDDSHKNGGFMINKSNICPTSPSPPRDVPEETVECALGWTQSVNGAGGYYVLLSNGSVWYWKAPTGSDTISAIVLISTLIGFIIGVVAGIVFMKRVRP
jgi:hypothetical protein